MTAEQIYKQLIENNGSCLGIYCSKTSETFNKNQEIDCPLRNNDGKCKLDCKDIKRNEVLKELEIYLKFKYLIY